LPTKLGTLYLIGAGPGDPELLTLKAVRLMGECDVILYDRLVSPAVLQFSKPDAELIYVGKREGEQEQTQQQIFDLILTHARAGKTVGRLKGGDPMVFGRGGEEWALAKAHAIPTVLIPGVSSAIGVPGMAGIPLTHRRLSNGFAVFTAPQVPNQTMAWERYAQVDTLVVLMGVRNRVWIAQSLIAAGRSPNDPAAFIERGSLPSERVVETVLSEVAAGKVEVKSPAVFVIGQVVKLRH
jgi:uroporphyrin-III C-methyltransferase